MKIYILFFFVLEIIFLGVSCEDTRASKKCNNPSGKIGVSIFDKVCGQSVCRKTGKKPSWETCPKAATEESVNELKAFLEIIIESMDDQTEILLNAIHQIGCPLGWTELGFNCYKLFEQTLTWGDAENYCLRKGAHLASVHSAEENNFLTGLTRELHWLGGNDIAAEGDWVWSDGSAWTFTNWASGQPDSGAGGQDCLVKNYGGTLWDDDHNYDKFMFVCKITN